MTCLVAGHEPASQHSFRLGSVHLSTPWDGSDFDKEMGRGLRYEDSKGVLRFEWELAREEKTIALFTRSPLDEHRRALERASLEPLWLEVAIARVKEFVESRGWFVQIVD
jgi:hypothetical protein